MKTAALILIAALAPFAAALPRPQESAKPAGAPGPFGSAGASETIFFAVLEGLYRDGVQNAAVDAMLQKDPETQEMVCFVPACPICRSVIDALQLYRVRPRLFGLKVEVDTFGDGLDAKLLDRITSADLTVRRDAMNDWIMKAIDRRIASMRLTAEETLKVRGEFEEMRKTGMLQLERIRAASRPGRYADMRKCPSCDAAVGVRDDR